MSVVGDVLFAHTVLEINQREVDLVVEEVETQQELERCYLLGQEARKSRKRYHTGNHAIIVEIRWGRRLKRRSVERLQIEIVQM